MVAAPEVPAGCPLTRTQLLVLECVAEHLPIREISLRLGIARSTVRVHQHNAVKRLAADDAEQAVECCLREGWLPVFLDAMSGPLPAALRLYVETFSASRYPHEPTDAQQAVMAAALAVHRNQIRSSPKEGA